MHKITALIVIAVALVCCCTQDRTDEAKQEVDALFPVTVFTEGYDGATWGMTRAEVRERWKRRIIEDAPTKDHVDSLVAERIPFHLYEEEFLGASVSVSPWFEGDSFSQVTKWYRIPFEIQMLVPERLTQLYELIENLLLAEFGRPVRVSKPKPNDQTLSAAQRIRLGEIEWRTTWQTAQTTISLELGDTSEPGSSYLAVSEIRASRHLHR